MKERNNVLKILKGEKPESIPWFGDLAYYFEYLANIGKIDRDNFDIKDIIKFHKDVGVGYYLQGHFPYKEIRHNVEITKTKTKYGDVETIKTPYGDLRQVTEYSFVSHSNAIKEHFAKTANDLKALRYLYENTEYIPDNDLLNQKLELVDDGFVLCYAPKSPIMHLVALLSGILNVTYMVYENQAEFEETLDVMDASHKKAMNITIKSDAEMVMIPENLSSEVLGKKFFHDYQKKYLNEGTTAIRNAEKISLIHMDGTLGGLLEEISNCGFDIIEAFTPKPTGDIDIQKVDELANKDVVMWGGLPGNFFDDSITDDKFDKYVIETLQYMKENKRFVLGVGDQVPPNVRIERIKRVRTLVDKYGRL